jgi:hypothetical protein
VSLEGDAVAFTAKDDAAGGQQRVVRLSAAEFLRRWVAHVLPAGFVKIRHYGLLANRGRTERLTWCRGLLALGAVMQAVTGILAGKEDAAGRSCCPVCGFTEWVVVAEWPRTLAGATGAPSPAAGFDTS